MAPELRRLLRWAVPVLGAVMLVYCAWQAYLSSLAHGGEIYYYATPRQRLVLHVSASYYLLLPSAFWLGEPRNKWLRLTAITGIGLSEALAFRVLEAYHWAAEVRALGLLALLLVLVVSLWQLIRHYNTKKAAV